MSSKFTRKKWREFVEVRVGITRRTEAILRKKSFTVDLRFSKFRGCEGISDSEMLSLWNEFSSEQEVRGWGWIENRTVWNVIHSNQQFMWRVRLSVMNSEWMSAVHCVIVFEFSTGSSKIETEEFELKKFCSLWVLVEDGSVQSPVEGNSREIVGSLLIITFECFSGYT
jgi:hypothetical protein